MRKTGCGRAFHANAILTFFGPGLARVGCFPGNGQRLYEKEARSKIYGANVRIGSDNERVIRKG